MDKQIWACNKCGKDLSISKIYCNDCFKEISKQEIKTIQFQKFDDFNTIVTLLQCPLCHEVSGLDLISGKNDAICCSICEFSFKGPNAIDRWNSLKR